MRGIGYLEAHAPNLSGQRKAILYPIGHKMYYRPEDVESINLKRNKYEWDYYQWEQTGDTPVQFFRKDAIRYWTAGCQPSTDIGRWAVFDWQRSIFAIKSQPQDFTGVPNERAGCLYLVRRKGTLQRIGNPTDVGEIPSAGLAVAMQILRWGSFCCLMWRYQFEKLPDSAVFCTSTF